MGRVYFTHRNSQWRAVERRQQGRDQTAKIPPATWKVTSFIPGKGLNFSINSDVILNEVKDLVMARSFTSFRMTFYF